MIYFWGFAIAITVLLIARKRRNHARRHAQSRPGPATHISADGGTHDWAGDDVSDSGGDSGGGDGGGGD